ncbi:hypothetical protein B6V74_12900 [Thioclava sp. F42-5]|uniref:hypothetical protein n=1 Tax=Thioclava sp. F42-5 TaxID=1973005 RepID=UPI000B53C348|nr:hypothetical protein [Thioclava sp. F42-5]OWY08718.1 hypothetical protein B6V74_12900 [Thioclava sp. F42-5]
MTETFDSILKADHLAQARFDAASAKLIADAAQIGIALTLDDCKQVPSVRLACLTDMGLTDAALEEAKRLPQIAAAAQKAEFARQLSERNSAAHAEIAQLNPSQRLKLGREIERSRPQEEKSPLPSEEAHAAMLALQSLPPSARLSYARKVGLA